MTVLVYDRELGHALFVELSLPVDRPSGQDSSCRGGRVKAAGGLPAKVGTTRLSCGVGGRDGLGFCVLLGKPLTRDGGSRFKGINSLKSSEDLWGPVRWQSQLDPFPYSEPLTNLAS
ncbi:hypothetical protein CRG98_030179 [Punica granatum]|uniref:Uncharacterized protein n=1 Tax=Punica granatum TaxID=22663 RepID=A0A2I0IZL5_PUNGR|nr:hypothetical protein CRG98_030179 [Punica granatum]